MTPRSMVGQYKKFQNNTLSSIFIATLRMEAPSDPPKRKHLATEIHDVTSRNSPTRHRMNISSRTVSSLSFPYWKADHWQNHILCVCGVEFRPDDRFWGNVVRTLNLFRISQRRTYSFPIISTNENMEKRELVKWLRQYILLPLETDMMHGNRPGKTASLSYSRTILTRPRCENFLTLSVWWRKLMKYFS